MKKRILALSIIVFVVFSVPVSAQVIESPVPDDLFTIIGNLTGLIQPLVLLTFVGVMIYGGYLRMTAAGDADQEAKAMQVLTGGIVGFIIIALSPVIVNLIGQLLNIGTI